jgi:hypothetical protein
MALINPYIHFNGNAEEAFTLANAGLREAIEHLKLLSAFVLSFG